jgi:hypothetical protein
MPIVAANAVLPLPKRMQERNVKSDRAAAILIGPNTENCNSNV